MEYINSLVFIYFSSTCCYQMSHILFVSSSKYPELLQRSSIVPFIIFFRHMQINLAL